jgi:mycothione reductase
VAKIKEYDVLVVGSGAGAIIADRALSQGLKVALVDKGPVGGTCLNLGCIPSKLLIYPADLIRQIKESEKLFIKSAIERVDFALIMNRMRRSVAGSRRQIEESLKTNPRLDFYNTTGHFVADYTLEAGKQKIKGKKIFLVAGARPLIPNIKGLGEVDYLTNETLLDLKERPESLIIIGGGYIAAEYSHFFEAMGTRVTIIQRGERMVKDEEPEISRLLQEKLSRRLEVILNTEVVLAKQEKKNVVVVGKDKQLGKEKEYRAERILVAAGRQSNTDLLKVGKSGIEIDERGYIKVNQYLETSKENIWALGDIIGKKMFRHVANEEAQVAWVNSQGLDHKHEVNYLAAPHAIFSWPQIASVGLTEAQARETYDVLVGRAKYKDVVKGEAMAEEDGLAKIIIDRESGKILGYHIIGPYAPSLIQEVVAVMSNNGDVSSLARPIHIHPALSEVILAPLRNLR